jgi:hypothetical protein
VTALLVVILAGRVLAPREPPAADPVPPPVAPVVAASVSAAGPPAVGPAPPAAVPRPPQAAPSELAAPAHPAVRHRLSQGIPDKIDDVGDPFAGKR